MRHRQASKRLRRPVLGTEAGLYVEKWDGLTMDFGYARVAGDSQDLVRQLDALAKAGIPDERVYADETTSATGFRPGLTAVLSRLREGDALVVCTLDRLGRNLRDTLEQIHSLQERRIGLRTLAYDTTVDTTAEGVDGARGKLAIAFLALVLPVRVEADAGESSGI